MNIMWSRLTDLEVARDEKVEPDAGEPAGRYLVDCLKQNVKLVEENDVLRYQYETMKNETARCKGLFDQLVKENQRLEEDVRGAHERVKELDKPYAPKSTPLSMNELWKQEFDELTKKYEGEKAAAIKLEESSTYWQQKYNEQLQTTDILYKELDFFRKLSYDLEMEKNSAKWYKEQAIEKCIDIVEQIKNDPLTSGDGICKNWMVAICEDIQKAIKYEFGVK